MTEAEWLACADPVPMLAYLREQASDRKLRLLACAWCRQVWYQLANDLCRQAVALSEHAADDPTVFPEMARVRLAAMATSTDRGVSHSGRRGAGYTAALYAAIGEMWHMNLVLESTQLLAPRPGFRDLQCRLTRDVFHNPSRPVTPDPSWFSPTVVSLAEAIYQERAFDRMPILADALEDAGCGNADVLAHCRSDSLHVKGCWAVDLVLGKE